MSYIHRYGDNCYKPGESLRDLLEDLIIRPFKEHPRTQPWVDHVMNTNHTYHRERILEQGRADFSELYNGLSPKNKVLLYCIYYLPMHLFSSYHIFTNYLRSINDKVVFIDFGCGPLTSGIAFWAFAQQRAIIYLGIDSSEAMRHKANEINRYGPNNHSDSFFKDGRLIFDYNRLPEVLERYKYIERDDRTQIIFNFSYFLASETLVVRDLSDVLIQVMEQYSQHKTWIVYQNPPIPEGYNLQTSKFHKNWYFLKTQLSAFKSQITQSNVERFSYDSLIDGLRVPRDVYFDILSNEPSAPSNNPFELSSIF